MIHTESFLLGMSVSAFVLSLILAFQIVEVTAIQQFLTGCFFLLYFVIYAIYNLYKLYSKDRQC